MKRFSSCAKNRLHRYAPQMPYCYEEDWFTQEDPLSCNLPSWWNWEQDFAEFERIEF
ncbi:MAG: hypothetical protein E6713_14030 [Sporomusaceae bacterium]|nr:hypothetical protein [Sporomusaceae bacterium]